MNVGARCSTCGEAVTLRSGDRGIDASPCACTRRRGDQGAGRPGSRPATSGPQRTTQRVRPPPPGLAFAPTARLRNGGRELALWLPRVPASVEGPNGRSWKVRSRAAVEWRELVATALADLEQDRPRGWSPVQVRYAVHLPPGRRAMDRDNLVACMKPVLDGLARGAVIPDDSPEHVPEPPNAESMRARTPWGFTTVTVTRLPSPRQSKRRRGMRTVI